MKNAGKKNIAKQAKDIAEEARLSILRQFGEGGPPPPDLDTELADVPLDPIQAAELDHFESHPVKKSANELVEESLRLYEQNLNDERRKETRWQGQDRWQGRENEEARITRIMSCFEFAKRLQREGVNVWLNDFVICVHGENLEGCVQKRGDIKGCKAGQIGVNAWVSTASCRVQKTVTTLQYMYGPEYSVMRFDRYNVPTREKYRGWRTALLVLIMNDVLREDQADEIFGPPIGPASLFYRQQLWDYRNRRMIA
jgi:hypothetical protein